MTEWKALASPKLGLPLELREVDRGPVGRIWEVQELRAGCVFKVTLPDAVVERVRRGAAASEAEAERAVCLAVEEALLTPPDKEIGVTYEVAVSGQELEEAAATSA